MASNFYELLGRLVVLGARLRYGRQIRVASGVVTVLVIAGGYALTRRRPPEG